MQTGKLLHVIEIERSTQTVNESGGVISTWTQFATLRAEVLSRATQDFLENAGQVSTARAVFRTHYFEGLKTTDRIAFQDTTYEIEEITRIGRRIGLEIRCKQAAAESYS